MIQFRGLRKRFGDKKALDDLSFEVPNGVLFGFLGPNGSGKTTTMRALVGLIHLDAGTITVDGRPIGSETRERIGYMPEERGLYPKMTVRDQLEYIAGLYALSSVEVRRTSERWIERLELGEFSNLRIEALSLGNKQRVQLAVAFIHNPEIMLLDEPFSGLDPIGTESVKAVLDEAAREGKHVIFSSHQLDLVESFCEQAAIIDRGHLVLSGKVADLTLGDTAIYEIVSEHRDALADALSRFPGVKVLDEPGPVLSFSVSGTTTANDVLALALSLGGVESFGARRIRLSEAFIRAIEHERFGAL
ncbi:MAG: ABC transporter ATP-binding protein [Acidimicrobiales bacterium]